MKLVPTAIQYQNFLISQDINQFTRSPTIFTIFHQLVVARSPCHQVYTGIYISKFWFRYDNVINFRIYFQSVSPTNSSMTNGEKQEKGKVEKFKYLKNKLSFFNKIKNIVHDFLSAFL